MIVPFLYKLLFLLFGFGVNIAYKKRAHMIAPFLYYIL